ncbi:hypothetical protein DDE18_10130 [Nocardioides gansuensis]|uniref:Uncharacterized protein n=1 Tax=Nocardioides gansuensis TaxID=2138300 RepID=A0A2T8FAG1_9ACTN|nr:hypothetical protein [Nocardioides gansuensis]PVG82714.1 hypothetical protein DDE18_10130 [Nocardioides gansuensis]
MRIWDALTGRRPAKANDLDALFLVPSAAITLQTAAGFTPTGSGSVCYRSAAGAAFSQLQDEVVSLIRDDPDAPDVTVSTDRYGFTWLVTQDDPADISGLCTDLHAVNTTLEAQGFASGLLCSMLPFTDGRRTFGLVYLYKSGTFYAFAPAGEHQRDNLLEISVRDHLAAELPMEPDLQKWLALWDAPGL